MSLHSVCIYCGSSNNVAEHFKRTAHQASATLAKSGFEIVYGGGHVGLMGIIADAAIGAGGKVTGIIPEHIRAQEVQHTGLSELIVVKDMHTRKRMMVEKSDAFLVLPGGLGTLDETMEIMTWKKLKLHKKPIILFNEQGYWDPLLALLDQTIKEGFAHENDKKLVDVVTSIDDMLAVLKRADEPSLRPITEQM